MFTLTVHPARYAEFSEQIDSLEGARIRASAVFYDSPVTITDEAGNEYSRYGMGTAPITVVAR